MHAASRSTVAAALATLALLGTGWPGVAQTEPTPETGRIMGQIVDATTGEPLPGARVVLGAGPGGAVAGVQGRYQIEGVPVGRASIRVLLLGYAEHTVDEIEVPGGGVARIDVPLERAAVAVAGITVSAQQERGSAVSLLSEQRLSTSVVNAISAEQIGRSPDGDAAAAMRRVSGVTVRDGRYIYVRGLGERYTTSSLNGTRIPSPDPERKMVPLDLFPAGLLESISTSKTFTPDQPGDFSGGSVDIRTPAFPHRRTVSFSMGTGFHPDITGRPILAGPTAGREWLAAGASARAMPDAAREFSGTVTRGPEVNEVVNSFRNVWSVREESGRLPASFAGSVGGSSEVLGRAVGYLGSVTYSNGQEVKLDQRRARTATGQQERDRYDGQEGTSSVLWGGLAHVSVLFGSHSQVDFTNSYNRSADHHARREVGTDENTQSLVRIDRLTYVERTMRSHQVQAQHQLGEGHRLDWNASASTVSRAEPDRSELVTWLDPNEPIWFKDFEGAVRTFGSLEEDGLEGGGGYTFSFGADRGSPNRLRAGVSHRRTEREAESVGFRIQPFHWTPNDARWQLPPEEFFDGRFAGEGDDHFILAHELSGGSYDAGDRLTAGYVMAELQATDRIHLVGGIRVERYTLDVHSENQLGQRRHTRKAYTDHLPSVATTVRLREGQQVRLSASRTLARPEYREVAPIAYREVLGGEQVIGNVDLERTLITNLDARWEWYPRPGEVISVGGFSKWFDDPIEQRYLARSGTNTRTFENAESATNHGVELEIQQRLDRVHSALEPLAVFGNVTLMRSRVTTRGERDVERAMVGQAPFVVNAGLTYSDPIRELSATLLHNVVGRRIVNARPSGFEARDVIERPRHLVDVSLRFPVLGNASGKVDVKNVLDSPFEVLQGETVREYHRSGRSVALGLSWRW